MSKKKVIGIDINEVLRSRSMKFDRLYYEEFDGEGLPEIDDDDLGSGYKFDLRNDYLWEDSYETIEYLNEDLPEDISPLEYVQNENGEAPVDALAFKPETQLVTADEKFKRFMYQDYVFEIHGAAGALYDNMKNDVEKFYAKYKDQFDIRIVAKENWFTIPPTLFFLSKFMSRITKYEFVKTTEEIWDSVDFYITTDPEILTTVPEGKQVIKLDRPYNIDIEKNFSVDHIVHLTDNKEFEELIGYEKQQEDNEE